MKTKPMTEFQARYVDFFFGEAAGNRREAYRLARGGKAGSPSQIQNMHHHPNVQKAIQAHRELRKQEILIQEHEVIMGLHKEATDFENGTAMSRIQAWVWIGKHLGMWQKKEEEKKEESAPTIVVQSYGNTTVTTKEEKQAVVEENKLPENVVLTDFQSRK